MPRSDTSPTPNRQRRSPPKRQCASPRYQVRHSYPLLSHNAHILACIRTQRKRRNFTRVQWPQASSPTIYTPTISKPSGSRMRHARPRRPQPQHLRRRPGTTLGPNSQQPLPLPQHKRLSSTHSFAAAQQSKSIPFQSAVPSPHAPHVSGTSMNLAVSGAYLDLAILMPLSPDELYQNAVNASSQTISLEDGKLVAAAKALKRPPITTLTKWSIAWSKLKRIMGDHHKGIALRLEADPHAFRDFTPLSPRLMQQMDEYEENLVRSTPPAPSHGRSCTAPLGEHVLRWVRHQIRYVLPRQHRAVDQHAVGEGRRNDRQLNASPRDESPRGLHLSAQTRGQRLLLRKRCQTAPPARQAPRVPGGTPRRASPANPPLDEPVPPFQRLRVFARGLPLPTRVQTVRRRALEARVPEQGQELGPGRSVKLQPCAHTGPHHQVVRRAGARLSSITTGSSRRTVSAPPLSRTSGPPSPSIPPSAPSQFRSPLSLRTGKRHSRCTQRGRRYA